MRILSWASFLSRFMSSTRSSTSSLNRPFHLVISNSAVKPSFCRLFYCSNINSRPNPKTKKSFTQNNINKKVLIVNAKTYPRKVWHPVRSFSLSPVSPDRRASHQRAPPPAFGAHLRRAWHCVPFQWSFKFWSKYFKKRIFAIFKYF